MWWVLMGKWTVTLTNKLLRGKKGRGWAGQAKRPIKTNIWLLCECWFKLSNIYNHRGNVNTEYLTIFKNFLFFSWDKTIVFFFFFFFFKKKPLGVPLAAQRLKNSISIHEDVGSTPGPAQWVKALLWAVVADMTRIQRCCGCGVHWQL